MCSVCLSLCLSVSFSLCRSLSLSLPVSIASKAPRNCCVQYDNRTHDVETGSSPAANCPARSLYATERMQENTVLMVGSRWHWITKPIRWLRNSPFTSPKFAMPQKLIPDVVALIRLLYWTQLFLGAFDAIETGRDRDRERQREKETVRL